MIKYYPKVQFTLAEITGKSVLLIHGLTGCMFNCYKCFNYDEIVMKKHEVFYTIDNIIDIVITHKNIINTIVFSGGEFLLAPIEDIMQDLKRLKAISTCLIIVYTTGYFLDKMRTLWHHDLVDGFHIDLKLPYHLLNETDDELIQYTLGISLHQKKIYQLEQAILWTVEHDRGMNQIRSVKYPFLDETAFDECKRWIDELNLKYGKHTPYEVHPFFDEHNPH